MPSMSSGGAVAAMLALALLAAAQVAVAGPGPAPAPPGSSSARAGVVAGEVIVSYRAGVARSERAQARWQVGASLKRELLLADTELVRVEEGGERAAAASLARRRDVAFAEPNAILRAQATPNDARFSDLWGLHNSGQSVEGVAGSADADVDAPEAWNIAKGLGGAVRVAVVDTGVAAGHPDLSANMFVNPGESGAGRETNGVDDDANGLVDDFRGWDFVNDDNDPVDDDNHGTHVAGTIAGRANNALGVAGVAGFPAVAGEWLGPRILAIKVLGPDGGSVAQVADGLVYAGAMGARVANVSLGGPGGQATLDAAIKSRPGTLYVIAAGNGGSDGVGDNNDTTPVGPCNPASTPDAPNKLCVAATDNRDELAGFSNYGPVNVDLAAPGVSVFSTLPRAMVFSEDFEADLAGRWITNDAGQSGTTWGRSTLWSTSPSHSLADSPGTPTQWASYDNGQNSWARTSTGIDLTGASDCALIQDVRINTIIFDYFLIEATRTPTVSASWQELGRSHTFWEGRWRVALPAAFDGQPGVFVRYRLISNWDNNTWDGVYIDDVAVTCLKSSGFDASSYDFFDGTSMATPHVAGAAALLFARFAAATVAQVKDKILRGVDKKASLNSKVASGGRLNLYKAAAESTAAVAGGVLRFTAGPGQTNTVTATRFTDTDGVAKYRITDPYSTSTSAVQSGSRINPGAGCQRVNDSTVKCPVAAITRIILIGGDLNDTLAAATIAIPVTLDGGSGQDVLTAGTAGDILTGGPEPDRFTAGAGNDTINARHEDLDTLFSCGESTGDSDTVNADLAPNDPVTPSATNCEVVNKL